MTVITETPADHRQADRTTARPVPSETTPTGASTLPSDLALLLAQAYVSAPLFA